MVMLFVFQPIRESTLSAVSIKRKIWNVTNLNVKHFDVAVLILVIEQAHSLPIIATINFKDTYDMKLFTSFSHLFEIAAGWYTVLCFRGKRFLSIAVGGDCISQGVETLASTYDVGGSNTNGAYPTNTQYH